MIDRSMKIDPDAWYRAFALEHLGITEPRIAQAVDSGDLKATDFTLNPVARQQAKFEHDAVIRKRGQDPKDLPYLEGLQFRGADVLAWIGEGLPTGKTAPNTGGRTIVRSTQNKHNGGPPIMNKSQAIEAWNVAVKTTQETAQVDRAQAVTLVRKRDPRLHKNFMLACAGSKAQRRLVEERF